MCKNGEPVDHLLLYHKVARIMLDEFSVGIGLSWVMPPRLVDFLTSWRGFHKWQQYGEWLLYVCVGVFSRREMIEASRIARKRWMSLKFSFLNIVLMGRGN